MARSIGLLLVIIGFAHSLELRKFIFANLFHYRIIFKHCILAPYFKKCYENDLKTCGPDAANTLLSVILKGAPAYGIPSFFSFQLGQTDLDEPAMKFTLNNCQLHGFESLHVYEFK